MGVLRYEALNVQGEKLMVYWGFLAAAFLISMAIGASSRGGREGRR